MQTIETEVCIIGAGPGGAGTALRLSYLGIPCTIIDKATFPRDKICGDAISGKITTLLGRLDPAMLARFRAKEYHSDVWGIRFYPPNGRLLELPFKIGYERAPEAAPGYVAKRMDFDNFLVEEIRRRADINLREGVSATAYERSKRGWRITLDDGSAIDTRILVPADGAHSAFSRKVAGLSIERAHHAAALRAYYKGVTGFHKDNFIELHFLPELNPGYFWVFPLPNGQANVGIGVRSDIVSKRNMKLRELLPQVIENNPSLKARFAQAEQVGKVHGYGLPLGSKARVLSGDHYMLVGDAGHLIDPLTGEGIGNAFYSGFIAAEQAQACLAAQRYDAAFLRAYDKRIDRVLRAEMRLSYRLQRVMQHMWLTNMLTNFINSNQRIIEILCRMYTDFDLRLQLVKPAFWLKLWFNKPKKSKTAQ